MMSKIQANEGIVLLVVGYVIGALSVLVGALIFTVVRC